MLQQILATLRVLHPRNSLLALTIKLDRFVHSLPMPSHESMGTYLGLMEEINQVYQDEPGLTSSLESLSKSQRMTLTPEGIQMVREKPSLYQAYFDKRRSLDLNEDQSSPTRVIGERYPKAS